MRTILCFGDSNTWGTDPATDGRFGRWERWPGVVQRELGDEVHVVEEGLSGRTTMYDSPEDQFRNGLAYLPVSLETHAPIDVVVIFLGTNDLFLPFRVDARGAARGIAALVDAARTSASGPNDGPPAVLAVVPPPFASLRPEWALDSPHGLEESARLGDAVRTALEDLECRILDLDGVATSSPLDGIHFEAEQHRRIGTAIAAELRTMSTDP